MRIQLRRSPILTYRPLPPTLIQTVDFELPLELELPDDRLPKRPIYGVYDEFDLIAEAVDLNERPEYRERDPSFEEISALRHSSRRRRH